MYTQKEHPELHAQAEALGLPGVLILTLITTFGPAIAQLLLDLISKKNAVEPQGMRAPGDALAFKNLLLRVIELAEAGAKLTPTTTDDAAVSLAKEITANTNLVEFIFQLLGK